MRKHKFRAWDKKYNRWFETELKFYGFHLFGECTLMCPPNINRLKDIDVMQSTELTDINGVDVYEGDKVNKNGCVYFVKWIHNTYRLCTPECKNNEYISAFPYQSEVENLKFKVVGNIYEENQ